MLGYHIKLHTSQTNKKAPKNRCLLGYHIKLHTSQTILVLGVK